MIKITENKKNDTKTLRVKKESWKYLKSKSTDKETSIIDVVDILVKKDKEERDTLIEKDKVEGEELE